MLVLTVGPVVSNVIWVICDLHLALLVGQKEPCSPQGRKCGTMWCMELAVMGGAFCICGTARALPYTIREGPLSGGSTTHCGNLSSLKSSPPWLVMVKNPFIHIHPLGMWFCTRQVGSRVASLISTNPGHF